MTREEMLKSIATPVEIARDALRVGFGDTGFDLLLMNKIASTPLNKATGSSVVLHDFNVMDALRADSRPS